MSSRGWKTKTTGATRLGDRLKHERKRQGRTVQAFANDVGISASQITAYENRGVYPTHQSLLAIAVALGCSLDWLCGMEDEYRFRGQNEILQHR